MNESVFEAYSLYYNLLYSDKDHEGEAKYISHLLKRNGVTQNLNLFGFYRGVIKCCKKIAVLDVISSKEELT